MAFTLNQWIGLIYGQLEQPELVVEEQELHPHRKNGKMHPLLQSSTNTSDVRQEHVSIAGTSSQMHDVHEEVHQLQPHGSLSVKHRESVPTEVSTSSLY